MKVVVRVDASADIGIGHLMRCLALADALRVKGANVSFVCRCLSEGTRGLIQSQHALIAIDDPAVDADQTLTAIDRLSGGKARSIDWLIVDHYGIGASWETMLRPHVTRIMVIDDLANRRHDCDILLDQNFYEDADNRYERLVPARCIKALGPSFALLRREFYETPCRLRSRDGSIRKILVGFGGSDPTNETVKTLRALSAPAFDGVGIDVIIGPANRHARALRDQFAADPRVVFHERVMKVAELMSSADLAIGAGGTMTWERSYLGLPAIVIVTAENQAKTASAMHRIGAIINLGSCLGVDEAHIAAAVEGLAVDPQALRSLGEKARAVMSAGGAPAKEMRILNLLVEG